MQKARAASVTWSGGIQLLSVRPYPPPNPRGLQVHLEMALRCRNTHMPLGMKPGLADSDPQFFLGLNQTYMHSPIIRQRNPESGVGNWFSIVARLQNGVTERLWPEHCAGHQGTQLSTFCNRICPNGNTSLGTLGTGTYRHHQGTSVPMFFRHTHTDSYLRNAHVIL